MSEIVAAIEGMQIVSRCVVIQGIVAAGSDWLRAEVTLDGRPLLVRAEWTTGRKRTLARSLIARWPATSGRVRRVRFVVRAIAEFELTAADSERLTLTLRSGYRSVTMSNLLESWRDATLRPAVEAMYGRFIREVAAKPGPRLLELGSRARSGHERRSHFPSAAYTGLDILPGESVDVVGDAHQASSYFPPGHFAFVTSVSVFEHLAWPWKAVLELEKVMAVGGLIYTQSHQTWPLHDEPWDYFRFSKNAWRALFCAATGFEIVDTAEIMPARIVPVHQTGDPSIAIEDGTGYLLSACLARKIGPATVEWAARPALVDGPAYPV